MTTLWLVAEATLSFVAFAIYGWDKAAAKHRARRIPEATLHLVAFLGGWPGAALAQRAFRHKTQKRSFQTTFRIVVVLNVVVTAAIAAFFALGLS